MEAYFPRPIGEGERNLENRREHPRYNVSFKVSIQILVDEETLTPSVHHGEILNISRHGIKLCVTAFPAALYRKLLLKIRFARIAFECKQGEEILKITGSIVWSDFRRVHADCARGPCYLGVHIKQQDNERFHRYTELVEKAAFDQACDRC